MPNRLRASRATGSVAIYTVPTVDSTDDAPFTNPLANLSRVKFHSALDYPKVIEERTINLSLPLRTTEGEFTASYNLFAHGQAGFPWVLASFRIGSLNVAATGSVPVQKALKYRAASAGDPTPWPRWISIGATSTMVTAYEYTVLADNARVAAITIPVTVWVTDELL